MVALAAAPGWGEPPAGPQGRDLARPARLTVFRAAGFPTVDAPAIPNAVFDQALSGLPAQVFDSPVALAEGLSLKQADVLVLPYGSAFPFEAWPAIRRFVKAGGGLVVLGGAPFEQPVRQAADGSFALLTRQPSFAHEFLIGPVDRVTREQIAGPARVAPAAGSDWSGTLPEPQQTFALTLRLATKRDLPGEDGTAGPRDAVARPLVHVVDKHGLPRACPLLAIDRLRGNDAGARWIFAPSDAALDAPTIRAILERALEGSAQIDARPVRASVEPGETATLRVFVSRPAVRAGEGALVKAHVKVSSAAGAVVFEGDLALQGPADQRTGVIAIKTTSLLAPGLYRAEVTLPEASFHPRATTSGFWVRDEQLLTHGPKLSVSRDWIRADGQVLPVIGTTYMASDVHRKFMFEPNPHAWDQDFAEMARRGINFVRTGLWTAWSRAMLDPNAIDENVLSALDAYVQSAARHRVLVCFNFFAFQPPMFGGTNPFLDPRALEGQRALLTLVASRYGGVPWVHWDLINEPSYAPADSLWTNQPVRDATERQAWSEWVYARHGTDLVALADKWRVYGDNLLDLPRRDDHGWTMIRDGRLPRKAHDFAAFSQDVVAGWARILTDTLKAAGGDDVLVTLGQDEGGTGLRPAQQLYAESVDYTAVHTWWFNDDLLWDGVVTKVPERPNLHQETGLMRLEDADGNHWRTPEVAAQLLERKFAYAFVSRGAGGIEWAWNINPYQPIDNESVIGLFRPDGTAKLELRALSDMAPFFAQAAPLLDDFEPEQVVMVIPHARLFSGRPGELDATKRVTRLLAERFGIVPQALSDQRLTPARLAAAKLVIMPVPEVIGDSAARELLAASKAGKIVLITGAVEGDPYGHEGDALRDLGLVGLARPVAQHERTPWSGAGWVTFDGQLSERLRMGTKPAPRQATNGVWHEPLPLEFADEPEPLTAVLAAALQAAGVTVHPSDTNVVAHVLRAPKVVLATIVNETPVDAVRRVEIEGRRFDVPVLAGRSRFVLFERGTAKVLASTPGTPVTPAK